MERTAGNLELIGGHLCLDFVNTVSTRSEAQHREYLTTYEDLVAWGRHAHILAGDGAEVLLHNAARHPELAATALDRAITLRETIYRIFSAIAANREPDGTDLVAINAVFRETFSRLQLSRSEDGFEWTWISDDDELSQLLWPIAHAAADLLTSADLARVRQCAREGCDWLFVDMSKNQSRRWCSMNLCGSRVKSRRYYRRKKKRAS